MNHYLNVLRKYSVFSGRASRKEYWMFALFNAIIAICLSFIDGLLNLKITKDTGLLNTIYSILVIIPSLGVGIRRLHDIGKSGFMMLISLIPIIGWIWLIVLFATDSNPGDNKYGPNPKMSL